jgi:hypothetical protein
MQNAAAAVESALEEPRRLTQEIALNDIHNATVQRGLDVWTRVRAGRLFPARTDLTPRMLSELLRNTVLVRVLEPGEEYELRIVGDAMAQAQGRSFQGMSMAEIDLLVPGHGKSLRKIYNAVCARGTPVAFRGWYTREADGRTLFHETVVTPLSNDGRAIDHLLVFAAFAFTGEDKFFR